ncbi:ATP-grasp domain-containing protein [Marinicella rhabdoformis]|uniref:ATP-grasp domain-containing protein n=1 Tax=Marinicella rhabdoformis TaxID=2580566 RepID=UPI0012AEC6DA|nr:hypothetical protein [Marinicella rhabdoformis]
MKIAIITCADHPQGVSEDQPLFMALKQAQIDFHICIWNHPHDWSQFDVCLLRSVWDYHEKPADFIRWAQTTSKVCTLLNPVDVIEWNRDKKYLKELSEHQINIAPTIWLTKQTNIQLYAEIIKLPKSKTYFLKPTIGADSSGTFRFTLNTIDKAQTHLNQWLDKQDMILQSYLPSVESYGEVSLIFIGNQYSHAIRKIPVAGDYRVQDTFGAKDMPHQPSEKETQIAYAVNHFIINKFKKLCYARIDLLIDHKNNAVINEVELIEPSLFFHHKKDAANTLVNAVSSKLYYKR